jgi:hypothetical protein
MEWLLLVILVVVVLVLGVLAMVVNATSGAWAAARSLAGRRRERQPEMRRLPAPRCLRCRGTGWLNRDPERTFTFTGDGFEDKHTPATMCPDCGGTGVAPER